MSEQASSTTSSNNSAPLPPRGDNPLMNMIMFKFAPPPTGTGTGPRPGAQVLAAPTIGGGIEVRERTFYLLFWAS
jgi:hypothetical protein